MACRYTYQGKTYEAHEFDDVLRAMSPSEASKYMTGVQSIPDAPLIDKTDKWLALSLKRIVKMAVDGGYDKVAFVNGQQSADRYDLSKSVDSIKWRPNGAGGGRTVNIEIPSHGNAELLVNENGKVVGSRGAGNAFGSADGKQLDEVIGKEIASKIMQDANGDLSGGGLKVGGEGMKAFYDQIVPNATKALLKKLGGGQMESVTIPVTEFTTVEREMNRMRAERGDKPLKGKSATQTGFTITPAMQEKASGGLPLFAKNTTQFSPAAQAQSIEAVEATVDALRRGMLNAPEVVVAFDMQDARIPRRVHQEDLKQRSGGARGAPEGFY